ncbi:MAG: class I poly(R)-hydroxyalkanoic acid synthase, partial [Giesbergeria sp.]
MSSDSPWAQSAQQFQQVLGESWQRALQAFEKIELPAAAGAGAQAPIRLAPDKLKALQEQYLAEASKLWTEGVHAPKASADKRFAGESWTNNPVAAFSAAAYLLNARTLMGLTEAIEGDEKTRAQVRFGVEQWVAAMAPSNFLAFNAEAQRKAIETKGESIAKGIANLMRDMRQGHVSMTDESLFEVGRNVATTEGAVVYENDLFQLIEYKPLTDKVYE